MLKNFAHEGVGLVIRTEDASLWFVQQKDETYPIEKWQLSYSVWGGAMEKAESPETALLRELKEELDWQPPAMPNSLGSFLVQSDERFPIHLFEWIFPEELLQAWAETLEVKEGYGKLLKASQLFERSWVWDLDQLIRQEFSEFLQ